MALFQPNDPLGGSFGALSAEHDHYTQTHDHADDMQLQEV
jgi:hypothetical protein